MEIGRCKACGNSSFHIQDSLCATCFNNRQIVRDAAAKETADKIRRGEDES